MVGTPVAARRGLAAGCLAVALLGGAAQAQPQAPAGTTMATAIILPHIADEFHGVAAEHAYIASHFETWHIEYQSSIEQHGRRYDLLGMIEPNGTKTVLYFDITEWFGK